jgi:hypothetical protein
VTQGSREGCGGPEQLTQWDPPQRLAWFVHTLNDLSIWVGGLRCAPCAEDYLIALGQQVWDLRKRSDRVNRINVLGDSQCSVSMVSVAPTEHDERFSWIEKDPVLAKVLHR